MNHILTFILICNSGFSFAQRVHTTNFNTWFMYFGDHKISSKLGVHLEAQWRRHDFISKSQQLLLRPGINYHLSSAAFVTMGYAFVETYPYGEFPVKSTFPEHRFWEQIQLKNQIGKFECTSRFRLEQRWLQLPVQSGTEFIPGTAVYQNRFRLLSRFSLPIKGRIIADKSWYLSMYDELMVSFGHQVGNNIFDQNRLYLAVGYKIPDLGRFELGYLNHILIKSDGIKIENNHTLQLGLSSTLDFYKKN